MVKPYKVGLILGSFVGLVHLVWAVMIALFPSLVQSFLNRIFGLHFLQPVYILTPATRGKGILLVVITFIVGCIMGTIFGYIWNMIMKK